MARQLRPFRRSDGLREVAVIGNLGLAHVYNPSEKVTHFVEDETADRDSINSDSYYIQLDENYRLPEYKSDGVHLLRNITLGDEKATYEYFTQYNDSNDEQDWIKEQCPASDFQYLLDREKLIPMRKVTE